MSRITIVSLRPIGGDFWKAEISVAVSETIEDRTFGQQTSMTIRFKFSHEDDVRGLLRQAMVEARRCLAAAGTFMDERNIDELIEEGENFTPATRMELQPDLTALTSTTKAP